MPAFHQFAARTIISDLPLPELPAADRSQKATFHVSLSQTAVVPERFSPDWQHGFVDPRGNVAFHCLRIQQDFFFDFPGIGQAHLTPDDRILLWQHPGASSESLRHVLLDQVLPRALAQDGHLVLHGSAVRTPQQQVLVILGDSGMGKSTLASAFACSGAELLSDDGVVVDFTAPRIQAVAGYPGLRLWPDSLTALFADRAAESTPMSHYNDKRRLAGSAPVEGGNTTINAILLLQAPRDDGAVVIEPLTPQAACLALTRNSFQLDLGDHANLECLFGHAAQASRATPVLSLAYPRDYARLPDVLDRITKAVAALG